MRPPTIYEVSRHAKVSIATVSRALNSETRHRVAGKTRERIDAVAKRLGYTPSLAARQLVGATSKAIGVVFAHLPGMFMNHYHTSLLAGIADALLDTGYRFKLILLKPEQSPWDRYDFRRGEAIDGLVVTHWPTFFSRATVLERLGIPCLVINDPNPKIRVAGSSGDSRMGGELAARYLYERGHRHMAIVAGPSWSSDSRLRVAGFQAYVRRMTSRVQVNILHGEYDEERTRQVVTEWLKRRPTATALFCCNDQMAVAALGALRQQGLTCPRNLSIMGYDDDPRAQTSQPPLTTIRVPVYDIARAGATRLVEHLMREGRGVPFRGHTMFPVELIERASTRRPT